MNRHKKINRNNKKEYSNSIAYNLSLNSGQIRKELNDFVINNVFKLDDSRFTFYVKVLAAIDETRVGLYLPYNEFLHKVKNNNKRSNIYDAAYLLPGKGECDYLIRTYERGIKRAFILTLHQSIESSIRLIEQRPHGGLTTIYEDFLDKTNIPSSKKYFELLEIIRVWRNSVHNNGIYNNQGFLNFNKSYDTLNVNLNNGDIVNINWADIMVIIKGVESFMKDLAKDTNYINVLPYHVDPTY